MTGVQQRFRRWRGLDLSGRTDERFNGRFWSKVHPVPSGCWEWTAHCNNRGYGQFTVSKGVFYGAHAVSYAITHGPIPAGMSVCHHCDNPPCVRPDHLFLGTQSDNAYDMFAKGRAERARGVDHYYARLTEDDVRAIRRPDKYRGLLKDLAAEYGVSDTHIRRIRARQIWRHLP
ncbi:HNH endonuclease signature motif containing protein [Micromonospora sp. NPDC005174]|uniref:HNH endonuclease signature motif containing protein n=1 Tax=Micromonospora sp. NPDC005174 TaxID=3157018 RepID=UPI0033B6EE68